MGNIMKSATMAGIGKGLGYMAFALNQVVRLVKETSTFAYAKIANKDIYTVEIMVNGVVVRTAKNQSASQISKLLKTMDNFGITNVTITRQSQD